MLSCALLDFDDYMRDLFLSRDEEELAGRILAGIISVNIALLVKHLADEKKTTLTDIFGTLQSLMGTRKDEKSFLVEVPKPAVQEIYRYLAQGRGPARLDLDEFRKALFAVQPDPKPCPGAFPVAFVRQARSPFTCCAMALGQPGRKPFSAQGKFPVATHGSFKESRYMHGEKHHSQPTPILHDFLKNAMPQWRIFV